MNTASPIFRSEIQPVWCSGCGNHGVLKSVERALVQLEVLPEQTVVVSGIGCSGRFSHYLNTYSLHGTHGRALPIATGVRSVRPDLTVLVVAGDGDSLGIGGGHLSHAASKNVNLTYLILDNNTYGLTKGQSSPTTPSGCITKTSPYGSLQDPLEVLPILLAYGVSFVGRTSSLHIREMTATISQAVRHPGFAAIHILTPCVTFPVLDWQAMRKRILPLSADYTPNDKSAALQLGSSHDPVYTGIFYREEKPILETRLRRQQEGALEQYLASDKPGVATIIERFL